MSDETPRTPEPPHADASTTRREALRRLGIASAAVPLSALPASAQETRTSHDICLDPGLMDRAAAIIDRAAIDPLFRDEIKARPIETLREMGIGLSEDAAAVFEMVRDNSNDPDLLVKAMLGQEYPPMDQTDQRYAEAAILPVVAVGVRVATRPATRPAVQAAVRVGVNVAVTSRTLSRNVSPDTFAEAMFRSVSGREPAGAHESDPPKAPEAANEPDRD